MNDYFVGIDHELI